MRTERPKMNQVKALLKEGMGPEEMRAIAQTVKCSPALVLAVRLELGFPLLKRGGVRRWRDPERVATARRMKIAGYTYKEIGAHLGVVPTTVSWYLRIPGPRNGSCEHCGRSDVTLHCHHLSYEDDTQFKLLCPGCHNKEHPEALEKARAVREASFRQT